MKTLPTTLLPFVNAGYPLVKEVIEGLPELIRDDLTETLDDGGSLRVELDVTAGNARVLMVGKDRVAVELFNQNRVIKKAKA